MFFGDGCRSSSFWVANSSPSGKWKLPLGMWPLKLHASSTTQQRLDPLKRWGPSLGGVKPCYAQWLPSSVGAWPVCFPYRWVSSVAVHTGEGEGQGLGPQRGKGTSRTHHTCGKAGGLPLWKDQSWSRCREGSSYVPGDVGEALGADGCAESTFGPKGHRWNRHDFKTWIPVIGVLESMPNHMSCILCLGGWFVFVPRWRCCWFYCIRLHIIHPVSKDNYIMVVHLFITLRYALLRGCTQRHLVVDVVMSFMWNCCSHSNPMHYHNYALLYVIPKHVCRGAK